MDGGKAYWSGKQVTCLCPAYDFPHRFGGGRCNGYHMASHCFDNRLACQGCICLTSDGCDVINQQESPSECPYVQDFCADWEVKIKFR